MAACFFRRSGNTIKRFRLSTAYACANPCSLGCASALTHHGMETLRGKGTRRRLNSQNRNAQWNTRVTIQPAPPHQSCRLSRALACSSCSPSVARALARSVLTVASTNSWAARRVPTAQPHRSHTVIAHGQCHGQSANRLGGPCSRPHILRRPCPHPPPPHTHTTSQNHPPYLNTLINHSPHDGRRGHQHI
jgi:hypothetical protein